MFFDTHTHLQLIDRKDVASTLERAIANGVTLFNCVGSTMKYSVNAVEIAKAHEKVYASVGIHPHDAASANNETVGRLRSLAQTCDKVVAIGETGLDYYRNLAPKDTQIAAFRAHLVLAAELGLPIIVHARDANEEALEVVEDFMNKENVRLTGVFHCFSGDAAFGAQVILAGFKVSFAGPITYKNAESARMTCATLSINDILLETDAPYLAPHPHRGEKNESGNIPIIAEKVAELHGLTPAEVGMITTKTAKDLFGIG